MKNKTPIRNAVQMRQILEFNVAFPGDQSLTLNEYLVGGSRDTILNAAAFFLGFKSYGSKFDNSKVLLEAIFGPENNPLANELYSRIKAIENTGTKVGIVNAYSSLTLFEHFFKKEQEQVTQSHAEFERNMFKAYLSLNTQFTNVQSAAFSSTDELDTDLKGPMLLFCMQYPVSDKTNYDIKQIAATQLVKVIYLFQYLESDAKYEPMLTAFLANFYCTTWQEYLKKLIPLATSAIKNEHEAYTDIIVDVDEKFNESYSFIEKLIVEHNDELDENDFLTLREKPLYKVKDGVYRIIFNLFLVEKIFKGMYFLLRDINEQLPPGEKIPQLKSVYGYEFSENILLYKVLETIYPENCIRFSGKELADRKINGAPDYYLRKGKNVLVFESKDFLIRADKKMSFDFGIYEEEFAKTLYYELLPNGKEKAGAVMQLIGTIRKILRKQFVADTAYHYRDINIFPVLITHDHQYDTPGFNDLVNYWFQYELQVLQDEGLFIHHVKPIVVVNIDSLIYNQVGLTESIRLHEILRLYEEQVKVYPNQKFASFEEMKEYRMSKMIPFSIFIDKYFDGAGVWKAPPVLDLIAPALFPETSSHQ